MYALFIKFIIRKHILRRRIYRIYDTKKPSNLNKISLFRKMYVTSNVMAIENYK